MVLRQRLQGHAPQPRRDAHHEPVHPRRHSPNTPLPHVHDPLRPLQTSTTSANTPLRTHGVPTPTAPPAGPQRLLKILRHPPIAMGASHVVVVRGVLPPAGPPRPHGAPRLQHAVPNADAHVAETPAGLTVFGVLLPVLRQESRWGEGVGRERAREKQ
ncbi:hypothetical protein B0H10DRAFT_2219162 [Mycena sp. CBHHK59/15]|nr:hypothetical protein B0H10DRAFT_2219162 [Mycena sp. CBHHK59/15]